MTPLLLSLKLLLLLLLLLPVGPSLTEFSFAVHVGGNLLERFEGRDDPKMVSADMLLLLLPLPPCSICNECCAGE